MTLAELLARLVEELGVRHEAVVILEEASGQRLAALVSHLSDEAPPDVVAAAGELARRRGSGEPLQHVAGHWGFRHLDLYQDRRALIVRPETELVVEIALGEIARLAAGGEAFAADLGTGSGAIALSLASELDALTVIATDRSIEALALAAANLARLPPEVASRVHLLAADWYGALREGERRFAAIVVNPPYLAEEEWAGLDPVVRDHDPREALVAGPGGLEAIEVVLCGAPGHLAPGGAAICEIGASQGAAARVLATRAGAVEVRLASDLAGRDRVLVARF